MVSEQKKDKQEGPPHDPWEEVDIPGRNELSVTEVLEYYAQLYPILFQKPGGWPKRDIRREIEKEAGGQELFLRGPIQVAKGEELIIAINFEQDHALQIIFNLSIHDLREQKHYALAEVTGGQKSTPVEATIKSITTLRPETLNHFVISAGLARRLGIDDNPGIKRTEIRITKVHQKPEELDLDKRRG